MRGKRKFAGGRPAAGNFLLRRQKKVTKEKATPVRRLPLRASVKSGAVQLARSALRQCSLNFPRFVLVAWRLTGGTKPKPFDADSCGIIKLHSMWRN